MNEQIPEWLMKEALGRFCSPHGKANPETYAYIAGVMSRSGGVWVKASERLPEQTNDTGLEKEYHAIYIPKMRKEVVWTSYLIKNKANYLWLDESSAADKGDAIDGFNNINWDDVIEMVLNDSTPYNEGLAQKLKNKFQPGLY